VKKQQKIYKLLMPQMNDSEAVIVGKATAVTSNTLKATAVVLVGFGFVFQFLINYLLGFVRSLSTIVHLLLFNLVFRGFTLKFFNTLLTFVAFDFMDISPFYDKQFVLVNKSKNTNYEALGYESQYMLRNFGSAILFIILALLEALVMTLITCFSKNRKIWIVNRAYKTKDKYFWNTPIATLNEGFLLFLLCSEINLHMEPKFHTEWQRMNSVICIILVFFCIAAFIFFPCLYGNKLHLNKVTD
jgi:hypothetical protein